MTDIEDLMKDSPLEQTRARELKVNAIKKNFKNNQKKNRAFDEEALQEKVENVGLIPGSQKIYVKTFGCSHNISDSEFMMGQLVDYGYQLVQDPLIADLILINSCTVKNPSQDALMRMVFESKDIKKPVVVCGCVTQGEKDIQGLENVSMIGVTQIDRVVEVVEETLKGHTVQLLEKKGLPSLDLPKIRKNKLIEILAVNVGCLGNCTYCKTKHARGHLGSYHPDDIIRRVLRACEDGANEIWLTSEDTGAYGRDIGTNIAELLIALLAKLPREVMLRIGMTNPPYILEHLEAMAAILNHPQVFGFLHLPIQSASNTVLERMNREYTLQDFSTVADYLIKNVPEFSLSTDIICGFPGETDSEHLETIKLISKYRFEMLNISQFYPRPGTIAARMKEVESKVRKQRSTEVTNLFTKYKNTSRHLGKNEIVWFSEKEEYKNQLNLVGHTKDYTKVVMPFNPLYFGKRLLMKITECKTWHIEGVIIDERPMIEDIPADYFDLVNSKPNAAKEEAVFAMDLDNLKGRVEEATSVCESEELLTDEKQGKVDLTDNSRFQMLGLAVFLAILAMILKLNGI